MAHLAIRGHSTRGKEVIEILEMLGGVNKHNYTADCESLCFYISTSAGIIYYDWSYDTREYVTYTLEEFLKKFPYKIGDKVIIKTLPDYPKTIKFMEWFDDNIHYSFDKETWFGADAIQPYKEETMEEKGTLVQIDLTRELCIADEVDVILGDYEFVLKDGKAYFVKKKPQYPKTYKECCNVLGCDRNLVLGTMPMKYKVLINFQKLLICRDAYWKIVGDWKPDWNDVGDKYTIYPVSGEIWLDRGQTINTVLAFPTIEMRDAFYENFKQMIECCKELL